MTDDPFQTFDGAYVLGALSTADRESFEAHMEACDGCLHQVAALRGVTNLLALAPPDAFSATCDAATSDAGASPESTWPADFASSSTTASSSASTFPPPPPLSTSTSKTLAGLPNEPIPPDLLTTLLARLQRQRHRRRISRTFAGLVAACLLALAGAAAIGLANRHSLSAQDGARSSATVTNAFLTAAVSVTTQNSWDEVRLTCTYKSQRIIAGNYIAVAKDATGRAEVVASWPAIPGQTAEVRTPTTFKSGTITSVSILNARGTTLVQITV